MHFRRLMTPAAKFFVCKSGMALAGEAMEVLGGNGYVEELIMPRLYREMPVNSIWEGSGNIMALDVLRALDRTPDAIEVLRAELGKARGADRRLDDFITELEGMLESRPREVEARRLTEMLVLALEGALLVRNAPAAVADAFCASRFAGWSGTFGTVPATVDARAIVARAAAQGVA